MTPEPQWNLADVWESVAEIMPDRPAHRSGTRLIRWGEFDRRANALARDLLEAGLTHQSKVGAYLYSCPEYLETYTAALKAGMAPFNINYRYGPDEITYLLQDADAEAVVFHATFGPLLSQVGDRLPGVKRWYAVEDGAPIPDWASPYEELVVTGADRPDPPWSRSGEDLILLYTGGTTGMPKGVMWEQHELFEVLGAGGNPFAGTARAEDMAELRQRYEAAVAEPPFVFLPACPLMHGTGQFSAFIAMIQAGTVVTLPNRHFDPDELWRAVDEYGVNAVALVGDAFAKPLLRELDDHRDRYDLSTLVLLNSSGVMWSQATKNGLTGHLPAVTVYDSLGSSEAVGMGASVSIGEPRDRNGRVHARQRGQGARPRRRGGRAREWHAGAGGGPRACPGRVLQGLGEDRPNLSDHRRRPLRPARRHGSSASGRRDRAARTKRRRHQHRRGEGVRRGGRRGHQAVPGRARRRVRRHP